MINITGEVYITNLKELSPRLIGGTIYSFEKVKDKEVQLVLVRLQ